MYTVILVMIAILAVPVGIACMFHFIQALRRAGAVEVLGAGIVHDATRDDCVDLELYVAANVRSVTLERIILEREFAARVLAQAPAGFRERHPAPPPDYALFKPDLDHLRGATRVSRRALEEEKRRQHTDLVNAWADMCESVMTWEGRFTLRRGRDQRLVVPMRTDVAASGRMTLIYSYRSGLFRSTRTTTIDYRPRLVAVHG